MKSLRFAITGMFILVLACFAITVYTVVHVQHTNNASFQAQNAKISAEANKLCVTEKDLGKVAAGFIVSDANSKKAEADLWTKYANNPSLANRIAANDKKLAIQWKVIVKASNLSSDLNCS
jgi:hypothetical protein